MAILTLRSTNFSESSDSRFLESVCFFHGDAGGPIIEYDSPISGGFKESRVMMKSLFTRPESRETFQAHVQLASPLVRVGVKLAMILRIIIGPKASLVPIVRAACGPLESLLALHNAPPRGLSNLSSAKHSKCEVTTAMSQAIWDLIVAGSGPGGSITAALNANEGLSVLIAESGHEVDPRIPHHSASQMMAEFKFGGQELVLAPAPVPFAQGKSWGGGSEINSGLYHHLPASVGKFWQERTLLGPEAFKNAVEEVESRVPIYVQPNESLGCYLDSPIKSIGKLFNWEARIVPRWRKYREQDFFHYGMSSTYLRHAIDMGASRALGHTVVSLDTKSSQPNVNVILKGNSCLHVIQAKKVCLAAGVIGTPEILWRSKLAKVREFRFGFHAMIREVAEYDRIVNDTVDIDPHQTWSHDNKYKIGAAVSTPELLAATLAQKNIPYPRHPKSCAAFYISFASSGRSGMLGFRNRLYPYFTASKTMTQQANEAGILLREGISQTGGNCLGSPKNSYSTVHVFGSLPIGESNVVDFSGIVRGTRGSVFVRDASILPSAPLVNPQGPLMHLVTALERRRISVEK